MVLSALKLFLGPLLSKPPSTQANTFYNKRWTFQEK